MVFRLLYFVTGVVTAIPVMWALGWAVWGAPISPLEYVALLGSLILVISALMPSAKRRLAARVAFVGALAVWSCYLPAVVGMAKVRVTDQELSLSVFRWMPSSSALVIEDQRPTPGFPDMRLSPIELQQIKDTGINGLVSFAASSIHGSGKKSHATLIMQRPVTAPIALKEPDGTSVVYVQEGNDWKMFPPNEPTLQSTIRIEPMETDPNQSSVMVELATGALQGSGISWPKPRVENPGK
jgi:hypothetical protein